mmetsp:Transcript_7545/g.10957  ORF Transcript_7545/g.10957 Transcript_7545/m.10957 type:complete len:335 (-) Transcript_7545:3053-4057(-)
MPDFVKSGRQKIRILRRKDYGAACVILLALVVLQGAFVFRQPNSKSDDSGKGNSIYDAWKPIRSVCVLNGKSTAPVPVILISRGRSGSSSTWQVMSNLTGYMTSSIEYTGSNTKQATYFFNEIVGAYEALQNGNWILDYMCAAQEKYPSAGIVGFKWKPYIDPSFHGEFINSLKLLAFKQQVKVVRLRRNILDVTISTEKHRRFEADAHCKKDEADCIKQHLGIKFKLPTKWLFHKLERLSEEEDEVDWLLDELGVPHVKVNYEKLYNNETDVNEWIRIFNFLGVGPTKGLSREQVINAQEHASTHSPRHSDMLQNYEEVRNVLVGTKFERLLH